MSVRVTPCEITQTTRCNDRHEEHGRIIPSDKDRQTLGEVAYVAFAASLFCDQTQSLPLKIWSRLMGQGMSMVTPDSRTTIDALKQLLPPGLQGPGNPPGCTMSRVLLTESAKVRGELSTSEPSQRTRTFVKRCQLTTSGLGVRANCYEEGLARGGCHLSLLFRNTCFSFVPQSLVRIGAER